MTKKISTKVGNPSDYYDDNNSRDDDLGLGDVVDDNSFDDILQTTSINDAADDIGEKMLTIEEETMKEKEDTRSQIGTIFVRGFFGFLFVSVVGVIIYNIVMYKFTNSTEAFLNIGDVVPIVGSVIGAPLGFVMGYYFKG